MKGAPNRNVSSAWRLVAAGLTVFLASCSGDSTSLSANVATASTTADGGGGAYDTVKTAEETAQSGPGIVHPLSDPNDRESGGRQVIESPTLAEVLEPGALPEIAIGRANAPVTIVEYASLTCPHCAKFHKEVLPELKREYIDTGKVRLIYREFPIGKTSGLATIIMRCAKPEKQVELIGKYMAQQDKWVSQDVRPDPIFDVAKQVGMTRAEFDACRQNQSIIDRKSVV